MTRRWIVGLVLLLGAGCQDYKFNPVGKCIIQTGSARIQLSSVSTADILFVVDDSGSMLAEQQRLAANFGSFINTLAKTQADRKATGLDPLEFHLAITTSSIFEAYGAQAPAGAPPPLCGQPTAGQCSVGLPYSSWRSPYQYACTTPNASCVDVIDQYWPACGTGQFGQGKQHQPYPAGNFMAAPIIDAPTNPRVLHFTKDLAWETWGTATQDARITTLIQQFQDNIRVGACGSGMEQHFEAGKLAVEKALAGTQPGISASEWPHPGAKMVVVWVGDEDDCSNPKDPNKSLAFTPWTTQAADPNPPGNDACMADEAKPLADRKSFPLQRYADYFTTLGRPFSAAFIYSSDPASCKPDTAGNIVCTPGTCACQCPTSCTSGCGVDKAGECQMDPAVCGGKTTGTRFHDLSAAFRSAGASTLDGSVCAADFGKTLSGIAELVKPPPGLTLPTQPAATDVTLLQIVGVDGKSSRLCTGPGPATDWQFVDCKSGAAAPAGQTTTCITINHSTGHCEANPGETYIAQYLGVVPPGGCADANECAAALGGTADKWTCQKQGAQPRGTCLCSDQSL